MKVEINESHFKILGVTRKSTKEEIKRAYRKQVKLWHPDKFPNEHDKRILAHEKCKQINEAFSLLENYTSYAPNPPSDLAESGIIKKQQKRYNDPNPRSYKGRLDINRIRVNSSQLNSVGYDPIHLVLQVALKNGGIYQYYDVPLTIYQGFIIHSSKDTYFNKYIASRFRRELVK